ncbi:MurR/RpiR family transcriptional regulator [Thermosipho ferrireducens]|uniref:MurR/RpiR family transcriptional regulator n=1 Tax=Thermosipho ferrireducens TaxID=2571116 RepID=A0ABX7SAL1_9BACT|nr:MurR/RpiR family transcriptional regulator [Thermosipho ferrireducens]QTA38325.1 MurR/RpiR family transcriptional regulator [Thermosipho ferrireducens]
MENLKLGILDKLRATLSQLKPAEQKIAKYIIKYPDDTIHHSISELAVLAGVGEATISRLCRKLGFKGFQDLKISLARELAAPESDIFFESSNELITKLISTLSNLNKMLDEESIEAVVKKVVKSKRIIFFGVGSSGVIAEYGAVLFTRAGFPASFYTDPHMQIISAVSFGKNDVVFGISSSGNIRDTVKSMQISKSSGAYTVAITGGYKSRITEVVDTTIYIPPSGHETGIPFLSPHVCQMTILHIIFDKALSIKKSAREILRKADKTLQAKRYTNKNEKI